MQAFVEGTRPARSGAPRRWVTAHRQVGISIIAAAGVTLWLARLPALAQGRGPVEFDETLGIAATYHRSLSLLSARYPDEPEAAWHEYRRLTAEAAIAQRAIQIQPCFATWWAYEFMGLTLTVASQQLRDNDDGRAAEADAIERLGTLMWMEAQALLPSAASACGVTTLTPDH